MVGHDNAFPLNPLTFFKGRLFTWVENQGFGLDQSLVMGTIPMHLIDVLPSLFGFSLLVTQKIIFVFWFFLMGFSAYALASLINPRSRFFKLIAVVLYQFNFFLLQAWFIGEKAKFGAYIALPLVLAVFLLVYRQKIKPLKGAIFNSLLLFVFNAGGLFGLPLYGGFLVALGIFVLYFSLLSFCQKKYFLLGRLIALVIFTLIGSLLLNAYYLIPAFHKVLSQYGPAVKSVGGVEGLINWAKMISAGASFTNLFRLQGMADWYDNPEHPYAFHFLNQPALIFISFLWPILAFSSLILIKEKRKKKFVLYFALVYLVGLFFAAGAHPPLGFIYIFLMKNLPGFAMFRTPFYKFAPALFFANAFLVAFSLNALKEKLRIFVRNKPFLKPLTVIFCLFWLILILGYHFPFFSGKFFDWRDNFSTRLEVPEYVFQFSDWMEKEKEDDLRVLVIPALNEDVRYDIYDWGYLSFFPLPRLLTNQSVMLNDEKLDKNEKVILNFVYQALLSGDEEIFKELAASLRIGYLLVRNDFFYDLDWSPAVSPQKYLAAIDRLSWLKQEHQFGEWLIYRLETEFSPRFYRLPEDQGGELSFISNEGAENNFLFSAFKVSQSLGDFRIFDNRFLSGRCVHCNLIQDRIYPGLPTVHILPDSVFYPLVSWREEMLEKKVKKLNDPAELVNLNLGLASKRLTEARQLIGERRDKEDIKKALVNYRLKMKEVLRQLERVDKDNVDTVLAVTYYFEFHRAIFGSLAEEEMFHEVSVKVKNVFWELEEALNAIKERQWVSDKKVRRYVLDVPENGEYQLLFEKKENWEEVFTKNPFAPLVFSLDGFEATVSEEETSSRWFSLGTHYLDKGRYQLAIFLPSLINFAPQANFFLSTQDQKPSLIFPLETIEADEFYYLSFSYKMERGTSFRFLVAQDTDTEDKEMPGLISHQIDEMLFLKKYWLEQKFLLTPNPQAEKIEAQLLFEKSQEKENLVFFEDFKINKIWKPKIVLKKVIQKSKLVEKIPLAFEKINPTLYKVRIERAKKPYELVFSEGFHSDWQATVVGKPEFKSKSLIPEERHFLADGYANGWLINPEDSQGEEDYDLLIEFKSQKLFHWGVGASGFTFLVLGAYLLLKLKRKSR